MTDIDLLSVVVDAFERSGITYMVVGSFASTLHGEPRMTRDIDLVIDADEVSITEFVAMFDRDRFYVGDGASAVRRRDMFNIIDTTAGWKADLIVLKDRPFSASEFSRRTIADLGGTDAYVASAEDTVLAKLEWRTSSSSERQLDDVVAILIVQGSALDDSYLDHWAEQLGLTADLSLARRLASE